jgi:DNA-directed RNA polymerase specialized sigma24 family protein
MKAFVRLEKFDGRAAFSSWLTRIAINSALMTLRRRRNKPESSLDSIGELGESRVFKLIESSCSPEDRILQHETKTMAAPCD